MYRQKVQESIRLIYESAVNAVNGQNLIQSNLRIENNKLLVKNQTILLRNNVYVVGFGKAVLGMAEELVKVLLPRRIKGILSVPYGSVATLNPQTIQGSDIEVRQCARNNLPDEASTENARLIQNLVLKCNEDDVVLVLISGGGSACLSLPESGLTLDDKLKTIKLLVQAGADIKELNSVRKVLSAVKGGKLTVGAYPATIVGLIISDIVGDPLQDIASGPTAPGMNCGANAMDIIVKYKLETKVPTTVVDILKRSTSPPSEKYFRNVHNHIVGNNRCALHSAQKKAESLDYRSFMLSSSIEGLGNDVCQKYMELVKEIVKVRKNRNENLEPNGKKYKNVHETSLLTTLTHWSSNEHSTLEIVEYIRTVDKLKLCLINGGEITWDMSNAPQIGTGGRNLHLTLLFQHELLKLQSQSLVDGKLHVWFSSAGTDGIDGMTDVAGSIAYNYEQTDYDDSQRHLGCFDSFNYYKNKMDLVIKPGHTGTNVMDIHTLIIEED